MLTVDRTKILTPDEYAKILAELHKRSEHNDQWRATLIIFRLAAGCGLRASEISGLTIGDVHCDEEYPYLHVRDGKGHKSRSMPLTWDVASTEDLAAGKPGTTDDIREWKRIRVDEHGDDLSDPFVCSLYGDLRGNPLHRLTIRNRFITAVRAALGEERASRVTVHHGRHTCATLAVRAGIQLTEVRDALGHSSISITSAYLHVLPEDQHKQRRIFNF
jgi:integrase